MTKTDTENKILRILLKHEGRSNPIQVDELMKSVPLSDREIRRTIQSLINNDEYPIGSTTKKPYGFYIITNFDDYLEAIKNLSNRKVKLLERVEKLRKSCKRYGIDIPKVEIKTDKDKTIFNISNSVIIYQS